MEKKIYFIEKIVVKIFVINALVNIMKNKVNYYILKKRSVKKKSKKFQTK